LKKLRLVKASKNSVVGSKNPRQHNSRSVGVANFQTFQYLHILFHVLFFLDFISLAGTSSRWKPASPKAGDSPPPSGVSERRSLSRRGRRLLPSAPPESVPRAPATLRVLRRKGRNNSKRLGQLCNRRLSWKQAAPGREIHVRRQERDRTRIAYRPGNCSLPLAFYNHGIMHKNRDDFLSSCQSQTDRYSALVNYQRREPQNDLAPSHLPRCPAAIRMPNSTNSRGVILPPIATR